jgi:DNA-binding MarR family transcriptional regulator
MSRKKEGGYLISQIHQISGRIFSKKLRDLNIDINHAQGRIIFALWKKDEIPINDLSKETLLSKSTLTTMLERLEKSGHVIRKQTEEDKRIIIVCLTPKSNELRKDYQQVSNDMTEIFYKDFSEDQIAQFEAYLKKILKNLKNSEN